MRYFIRGALFRFRIHFPCVLLLRIIIFDIFLYDMFHGWVFFVKWYASIQRPNFGNVVNSFQSLVVYFLDNFHHRTDSKSSDSIRISIFPSWNLASMDCTSPWSAVISISIHFVILTKLLLYRLFVAHQIDNWQWHSEIANKRIQNVCSVSAAYAHVFCDSHHQVFM